MSVAKMIIQGILGGAGGGISSVAKNFQNQGEGTDHSKQLYNSASSTGRYGINPAADICDSISSNGSGSGSSGTSGDGGLWDNFSNSANAFKEAKANGATTKEALGSAGKSFASNTNIGKAISSFGKSDEELKNIYGGNITDNIIENMAKISAIDFNYKPEAVEQYNGANGVDNKEHIGVIAQELQSNPITEGTVSEDENGNLQVDTRHLAFADTAAIGELSRRVLALEKEIEMLKRG